MAFAYPFRIFFLSLALWALLLVPLWLGLLLAQWPLPLALAPLHWHQYEMLFGLLTAGVAGFLLTAVCAWTQSSGLRGGSLLGLWLVWLLGRLALMWGGQLPGWLAMLPDLLFLPLVMFDAGRRIVAVRQWRQLPLLVVLLMLWLLQVAFLIRPSVLISAAALIVAIALMGVVGGRITPAFSNNWLRARGEAPVAISPGWLDSTLLVTVVLLIPALLLQRELMLIALALLAAALWLLRLALWRGWRMAAEPLLWILHLSLLWIPVALLLLAGSALGWWPPVAWLHAAAIGAMASLILGVMSRVALGHTGRPLRLPPGMVTAFVALQLAALLRLSTAFGWLPWQAGVGASAGFWMLAFALFLWRYSGVLMSPRVDGKAG
jgi:uncharacterized protein involved in response to NO